ncbi:baseplate wedge subunit [Synechococcus phage S-CAM9]|uniref:Baseplate wedge subunit n=1 Tax=Synechococcus phage S-CAM9 TaxID=1883369 RepID=A0A1D8KNK0_9CAUD|nr:baseplate wedge subunit [Synechococcus phage S-CAM9]AOV60218.1 baseplate wedge subunit [Synechococcus phage S-CAM9]AOV60445.1 baseplate wedge subunit [Synechococcus phage S-CAM9]AOV60674.1 baseplate wedge subunit [Synechococcus phage S-CAM9]
MAFTQYTTLDFEEIKASIRDYLRSNSNFTDFDFEGSNMSILIDTLAYNTYVNAYNTNMVANEAFLDSATLRENVVALARNVGYVPRSRRSSTAQISFSVNLGPGQTKSSVTLKAGLVAIGDYQNTNYTFCVEKDITNPVINGICNFTVDIKEGTFLNNRFVVDTSQPNQRFVIPNSYVDTSTFVVRVRDSVSSSNTRIWNLVDNIVGIKTTSEQFLIQEVQDERYELIFGDGYLGKKLDNGQVVDVSYITTNGPSGNGVRNFSFAGSLNDNDGFPITTGISEIITDIPSKNGAEVESLSNVKNLAPRFYAAQHRAVTALDYEAIIPQIYPNTDSVVAYGGESATPPQFGKVFISIKPTNGQFISDFDRRTLLNKLKQYSVAGIVPEFIDLKFLYVELNSAVYYNDNAVSDPDALKTSVIQNLTTYANSPDLNKFGGRFKYSKVQNIIDQSSTAVVSNITKVKIRRDLEANVSNPAQYEICYGNAFHNKRTGYNIKSSGFRIDGIDGEIFMTDQYISPTRGRLVFFKLESQEPKIIKKNAGTVKYDVGEILIDTTRIISTTLADNVVEIEAIPESNDVLGLKDLYVQLSVDQSTISPVIDAIASGSDNSGTSFITTSSFSNGKYIRE